VSRKTNRTGEEWLEYGDMLLTNLSKNGHPKLQDVTELLNSYKLKQDDKTLASLNNLKDELDEVWKKWLTQIRNQKHKNNKANLSIDKPLIVDLWSQIIGNDTYLKKLRAKHEKLCVGENNLIEYLEAGKFGTKKFDEAALKSLIEFQQQEIHEAEAKFSQQLEIANQMIQLCKTSLEKRKCVDKNTVRGVDKLNPEDGLKSSSVREVTHFYEGIMPADKQHFQNEIKQVLDKCAKYLAENNTP